MLSDTPFNAEQWQQTHQFIQALDQHQALWLSGYLAAMHGSVTNQKTQTKDAEQNILIAYGTETDNCKKLAQSLFQQCQTAGINTEMADLANVRVRKLKKLETLIIITATHGDGDPPEPITEFYEAIMADNAPKLSHLSFAVLALGDSSYEHYCVTGIYLDQKLEKLGAKRLLERVDCDVDFEEPASKWQQNILLALPKTELSANQPLTLAASTTSETVSKQNPITVEVLSNQNLSDLNRRKPVHHLELSLEQENFNIEPGDAVGVFVHNPPQLVAQVLNSTLLSGKAIVIVDDQSIALREALRSKRDLTIPSKNLLVLWAKLTSCEPLQALLEGDSKDLRSYLKQQQVCDVLSAYPASPEPQELIDALRPLQPRLYDVANSLSVLDDELHLTVKAYDYTFANRVEKGIASSYLLSLQAGDEVSVYPHKNARFRLPDDTNTPLILIADGTGIAPYRAFIQALATLPKAPPCWLVFSEQHYEEDFLYQLDTQKAYQDGVLSHIDTVFYGDMRFQNNTLATPLLNQGEQLINWLKQGAHIYLCGDKSRLETCEQMLKVFVDENLTQGHWQQLAKAKIIHRNLY